MSRSDRMKVQVELSSSRNVAYLIMKTNPRHVIPTYVLMLLCIIQKTSQDKKVPVTYHLGRPAQNCTTACENRGLSCIEVEAFPYDTLSIFRSLNVTCTTPKETNTYYYPDSPNYCISGEWKGRCIGFRGLKSPHFTNCSKGKNPSVRRLCPCKQRRITTDASFRTTTTALSLSSSSSKAISHTPGLIVTPTEAQQTGVETKLNTLEISVIVGVLFLVFIAGLFFMVVFVQKRNKKKNKYGSPRIPSALEQRSKNCLRGSDNIVYMERKVDLKNALTSNGNPYDEYKINELYVSCDNKNKRSTLTTENPMYEESVPEKREDNINWLTDEYASIDEIELKTVSF